jgi:hypothetical protein
VSVSELRQHALRCLDRLRVILEHSQLSDAEITRLAAEINELLERHAMPQIIRDQKEAC